MSKRTKVVVGVLLLLLVFGVVYSVTSTETKADIKHKWVRCYFCVYSKECAPYPAFIEARCWVPVNAGCPVVPSGGFLPGNCHFVRFIGCGCGWPAQE